LNPLFGINPGHLDMTRFGWLGSVSQDTAIAVVSTASGIASIEDAKKRDVIVGATGAAGTSGQWGPVANATLGTRFKNVFGYPGTTEMNLAIERGEVECRLATYTALLTQKPEWFNQGKIKIILQMGSVRNPALAGVPVFEELVKTDANRAMVRLVSATFELNRPYMAPPRVPPERLKALRAAFDALAKDAALAAAGTQYTHAAPPTGEELDRAIAQVYATPPAIVERLLALSRTQEELERLQREEKARGGR